MILDGRLVWHGLDHGWNTFHLPLPSLQVDAALGACFGEVLHRVLDTWVSLTSLSSLFFFGFGSVLPL